ncbi:hypothetical protein BJY04DRAFT_225209 [Aspergillus karnatakaensis]|uniref:uncharacterized protein n=1 Tax=Aspergillus karnatakaensis TaxID=1810916 RepID=UPI003CCCB135
MGNTLHTNAGCLGLPSALYRILGGWCARFYQQLVHYCPGPGMEKATRLEITSINQKARSGNGPVRCWAGDTLQGWVDLENSYQTSHVSISIKGEVVASLNKWKHSPWMWSSATHTVFDIPASHTSNSEQDASTEKTKFFAQIPRSLRTCACQHTKVVTGTHSHEQHTQIPPSINHGKCLQIRYYIKVVIFPRSRLKVGRASTSSISLPILLSPRRLAISIPDSVKILEPQAALHIGQYQRGVMARIIPPDTIFTSPTTARITLCPKVLLTFNPGNNEHLNPPALRSLEAELSAETRVSLSPSGSIPNNDPPFSNTHDRFSDLLATRIVSLDSQTWEQPTISDAITLFNCESTANATVFQLRVFHTGILAISKAIDKKNLHGKQLTDSWVAILADTA